MDLAGVNATTLTLTSDDLAGIKTDIASLKSETHGQTELLKRLEATVGRISDWLIDRAK